MTATLPKTLTPVCYTHTLGGGRRRLSATDAREVMATNWGSPFSLIRELETAPDTLTESQALFLAIGFLSPKQWLRDGMFFEPSVLPTDIDESCISLEADAAESTLLVTIQIDSDAWDFVFQCRES